MWDYNKGNKDNFCFRNVHKIKHIQKIQDIFFNSFTYFYPTLELPLIYILLLRCQTFLKCFKATVLCAFEGLLIFFFEIYFAFTIIFSPVLVRDHFQG